MCESSRGFGWLICKNVDNAGEGLPPTGIVREGVELGWEIWESLETTRYTN